MLHEAARGVIAAGMPKTQHRSRAMRAVDLGEPMCRIAWQAWIIHLRDAAVAQKILGDTQCALRMPVHAQRQRFKPGERQETVERRERRAKLVKAEHAAGGGKSEIAE